MHQEGAENITSLIEPNAVHILRLMLLDYNILMGLHPGPSSNQTRKQSHDQVVESSNLHETNGLSLIQTS